MMKSYTLSYFINTFSTNQSPICKQVTMKVREIEYRPENLKEVMYSPSEKAIQNILSFSRTYEAFPSRLTDCIELIKN